MGTPKALVEVAGRPLWQWSVEALLGMPEIERVVLAAPATQVDALRAGLRGDLGRASSAHPGGTQVMCVAGGAVRSGSVRLALDAAATVGDGELVLVHDAARPLLSADLARNVLAALSDPEVQAAVAATPITDTVKQADGDGRVVRTLERSGLWSAQTPQVFRRDALERALDVPTAVLAQATDDAWLIERAGGRVAIVPAPRENLKVTTPLDLELAELLLAQRARRTAA